VRECFLEQVDSVAHADHAFEPVDAEHEGFIARGATRGSGERGAATRQCLLRPPRPGQYPTTTRIVAISVTAATSTKFGQKILLRQLCRAAACLRGVQDKARLLRRAISAESA
jgi:hypothetical protein